MLARLRLANFIPFRVEKPRRHDVSPTPAYACLPQAGFSPCLPTGRLEQNKIWLRLAHAALD